MLAPESPEILLGSVASLAVFDGLTVHGAGRGLRVKDLGVSENRGHYNVVPLNSRILIIR